MVKEDEQQLLKVTIFRLLPDGLSPKKMLAAVKAEYPKASKSDIIRAAFAAMIETADTDTLKSLALHGAVGLRKRRVANETEVPKKQKKGKPTKDGATVPSGDFSGR